MARNDAWLAGWRGTFEPRRIDGHASRYDTGTATWAGAAVVWVMEHARDARTARTMARIVTAVPYFVKDEDSGPNGETITQFSYRQMADMTGCSRDAIARNVPRLCAAGGPLERFWKPEQGDSSRGAGYYLRNVENFSLSTGNFSLSTDSVSESASTGERPPVLESTGVSSTGERPPVLTEGANAISTSTSVVAYGAPRSVPTLNAQRRASIGTDSQLPSGTGLQVKEPPTYDSWAAIADRLEAGEYDALTASEREDYTRGRPHWNERYVYERKGVSIGEAVNQ